MTTPVGAARRPSRPRPAGALLALALAAALGACAPPSPDGPGAAAPEADGAPPTPGAPTAPPVAANPTAAAMLAAVRERILASGACDDDCLGALRALWEAHPGDPTLRVALTNALIQRKDWTGIEAVVRSLPQPTDADRVLLAKALTKLGRFDEASAILSPLVDARPDDADLAYNAAYADFHGNRPERAAEVLDRAWSALSGGGDANPPTLRAMIHLEAGEADRAAAVAEAVVARHPDFFPAWEVLARARGARGDEAGALEALARVDAINAATEVENARRMRLSAQATALKAAWTERDLGAAEALVEAMLPAADPALQRQLYEYAVAIYQATGRPEEAEAARAAAERLPLGDAP